MKPTLFERLRHLERLIAAAPSDESVRDISFRITIKVKSDGFHLLAEKGDQFIDLGTSTDLDELVQANTDTYYELLKRKLELLNHEYQNNSLRLQSLLAGPNVTIEAPREAPPRRGKKAG